MTLDEFKPWFVGFCDAIPAKGGLSPDQWVKLREVIDYLGIPAGTAVPTDKLKPWTPAQMNNTMPLNYPYGTTPEEMFRGIPKWKDGK